VIIDTEAHVFLFAWPRQSNPLQSMVRHYTWHEHSGDLLVAEMDNAGVDKAFLISYDVDDVIWAWRKKGYALEDFGGGKKYCLSAMRKYPERFIWFSTLKDPRNEETLSLIADDIAHGARGVKIFPAHIQSRLDTDEMHRLWSLCRETGARVLISFENVNLLDVKELPVQQTNAFPQSSTGGLPYLYDYLRQLARIVPEYPTVQYCLLHNGCIDVLKSDEFTPIAELTNNNRNLYLSCAAPGNVWDDEGEYPFPNYLARIRALVNAVGVDKLMWATDWPWLEDKMKYLQALDAVRKHASFLNDNDKRWFLGDTAAQFLGDKPN